MIKNLIQFFFLKFGYKIINLKKDKSNLEQFLKELITNKNPTIFDVGANDGRSIKKFKKFFPKSLIHAFEPDKQAFQILSENYSGLHEINLNFFGVGEKNKIQEFFSYRDTGKSSFNELIFNSNFLKYKSKIYNVSQENFLKDKYKVEIKTIENYCSEKNIKKIDFLKIDTQGYEVNTLVGAENLLKKNDIDVIQLELIFSSVYNQITNIYDIEKILIPYGYRLFGTSSYGNLKSDFNWQCDFIYISKNVFHRISNNPKFKSFAQKK